MQIGVGEAHAHLEKEGTNYFQVSAQDQVQDFRALIIDSPETYQYSCFHLEYDGKPINEFIEFSELPGFAAGSVLSLKEDLYTERDARMHVIRIKELIGTSAPRDDPLFGNSAGLSLHTSVTKPEKTQEHFNNSDATNGNLFNASTNDASASLSISSINGPVSIPSLLPPDEEPPPRTVKSLTLSQWGAPSCHLRAKGHLLYLQLTTLEGDQYHITSHIRGFYINNSSSNKFDPNPRVGAKAASAHSLLTLIESISPSFGKSFQALLNFSSRRNPLTNYHVTNAIPARPWFVSPQARSFSSRIPDPMHYQEQYLFFGLDTSESLRDWNDEIQQTRELPREEVQDRVMRERLLAKLFSDFNEAAARGAIRVALGEVPALNPTEREDGQIFVYNNIFFSYGADGAGTFTSEGGDDAARVAVSKDVSGVKAVNQLDIKDLFSPGTCIIDFRGRRLVAQSIVPGIFKSREPDDNQVDYGAMDGKELVADNEAFVPSFAEVSQAFRVKKHPVWDKDGKKHVLESSVDTKGLLGTDARKYMLDLYRLTPPDISWIDQYWSEIEEGKSKSKDRDYPHRMALLRPELVDGYWKLKLSEYVKEESKKYQKNAQGDVRIPDLEDKPLQKESTNAADADVKLELASVGKSEDAVETTQGKDEDKPIIEPRIDISKFQLSFNPDVFCGQVPLSEEDKAEWAEDECKVRELCDHLCSKVMPELIHDLEEGEISFPMDGYSLSRLLHKRGINLRYMGKLISERETESARFKAFVSLVEREMISRAFKHVANRYLRKSPGFCGESCISHLLNCLLGSKLNPNPTVEIDDDTKVFEPNGDFSFATTTPQSLQTEIEDEVRLRFRHTLSTDWVDAIQHLQLLREISLKLGLQLIAQDYRFEPMADIPQEHSTPLTNGNVDEPFSNGHAANGNLHKKKKKRHGANGSPVVTNGARPPKAALTFSPDDIISITPLIKDATPKSALAEETLEYGRLSMAQNQKEIGQDLMFESLQLHEQVYGILHPEVARLYHQLAAIYYQLEEKDAAIDLAHKAVVISERTLGVDSSETILSYLNLALFEHGNGNTDLALRCMHHALELWKIVYGPNHPDSITTLNNAAVMLQTQKRYHESRQWFEASLQISEEVSGKTSVNSATLAFQLAQALALDHDPKGAVMKMRDAYNIFKTKLGADDRNTKEAEQWLGQLTTNAVSIAKQAKDSQTRRLQRILFRPRTAVGGRPTRPAEESPSGGGQAPRRVSGDDSRSIEDLLKYIEGGDKKMTHAKAKNRANRISRPHRRGKSTSSLS